MTTILKWLCVFATLLLCAPGQAQTATAGLEPIPELPLEQVAAPVRRALSEARDRLDHALSGDVADAVLAEAFGHLADVSFAHDLTAQARAAYRNAIELRPERQEWHYLLGLVEISEGRLDAGIAALDQAIDLYPRDFAVLIHRARARLQRGDLDAAAADFERARGLVPEAPAVLGGLGRVALERQQYQRAIELFEQALERAPAASRLHHFLGRAYRAVGDRERARDHLEQAGEAAEPFPDPVLDQVRQLSRSPQFYLEAGLSQAGLGQLEGAERMLARARELAPDDPDVVRNHGDVLARLGRLDQARAAFSELVELDPESPQAHFYLGQAEELGGRLDAALAAYQRAIEVGATDPAVEESIAHIMLRKGDTTEAGARFARLAETAEEVADAARFRYWQGLVELAAGRCGTAAGWLEQAHTLTDGYSEAVVTALARMHASCLPPETVDLDQALEWAQLVYDARPGLRSAATLAMVHAARGEFDDAIDYQAQAMFEAVKRGILTERPELEQNMARYREGRPAPMPFGEDHPVFFAGLGTSD